MAQEKVPEKEPESNFTFRMAESLREVVSEIAVIEKRSLSKVVTLLLWRGISGYRSDGLLLIDQNKPGTGGLGGPSGTGGTGRLGKGKAAGKNS